MENIKQDIEYLSLKEKLEQKKTKIAKHRKERISILKPKPSKMSNPFGESIFDSCFESNNPKRVKRKKKKTDSDENIFGGW